MARILVVDDEPGIREFVSDTLELDGHVVSTAVDGDSAIKRLRNEPVDLVVTDLKMPGASGIDLCRMLHDEQPETQVIVMTAHGSVEAAVEAMRLGAFDFVAKPLSSPDELSLLATRALERRRLLDFKTDVDQARGQVTRSTPLSHGDPAMQPVTQAIAKVAPTDATVLLLGESGTGKEVAAQAIHAASRRSAKPFVAINCAALRETLLESELFGHEKGAFTGATERRRGRLELCDGGTFFLDEVGELKLDIQAKLLRVLQERSFERVGGTQTIRSDIRWIAATNRDLQSMIAAGSFREDLYHRLAVFPVRLPPLRERSRDLLPLAELLLQRAGSNLHKGALTLTDAAITRLRSWSWPGNIRELSNVLERAAILADGDEIGAEHLLLDGGGVSVPSSQSITSSDDNRTLADIERDAIASALGRNDGNRRMAAEQLGIAERTLYDKIKKYGLS